MAEDLALAGCGDILPETVIGQLLPENADESTRKALNVIFNVGRQGLPVLTRLCLRQLRNEQGKPEVQTCTANSLLLCPLGLSNTLARQAFRLQARLSRAVVSSGGRQALPGSMRLCLMQLRNKQGISEVQTNMASSSLLYLVDLSNTLATQASRLQNRLSRSLACSKGQVFSNAHPVDFSLQSKRLSEFTRAVDRCLLFLEELGTHFPRYDLCFSAPFPAKETNRQLQAAAFQSSFSGSDSISRMRKCAEIYFSQFKSLGWDPWFPTEWQVAAFLQDTRVKRTTHANRMLRALEWIQACFCFGVETHFSAVFVLSHVSGSSSAAGERPLPKPARMATVEMLVCFEELVFSAPSSTLQCWAGVQVALGHGVLRWSDLQHSVDLTLTDDALMGITWRMKKRSVQVLWAALRIGVSGRDWAVKWLEVLSYHGLPGQDFVILAPSHDLKSFKDAVANFYHCQSMLRTLLMFQISDMHLEKIP